MKNMPELQSNNNSSKVYREVFGAGLVISIAVAAALLMGIAALALAPPLTGRLHPAVVPGLLVFVLLAAAIAVTREPRTVSVEAAPSSFRPIFSAALAVVILGFGTRPLGIFVAAFAAATVAALGVAGVTPRRALVIGLCLAAGSSILFAMALRQPLPVFPPGMLPGLLP